MSQGLVLDCTPLEWEPLEEFPDAQHVTPVHGGRPPVWLALDEIEDPVSAYAPSIAEITQQRPPSKCCYCIAGASKIEIMRIWPSAGVVDMLVPRSKILGRR
jgi:hypothetical protein